MSISGGCRHEHDLETDSWICSRELYNGSDYCIFHQKSVDEPNEVRKKLLKELHDADPHGDESQHPRYLDAELGTLKLDFTELAKDCPFPIDFRHANIEILSLTSSEVIRPLHIQHTTIDPPASDTPLNGENTLFRSKFTANKSLIKGDVDLKSTECRRTISFEDAEIYGSLYLDNAHIDGNLNLSGLEIDGDLHLENVTIDGNAIFEETIVNGDVYAHDLEIRGNFSCDGALLAPIGNIGQPIDFSQLTVRGKTTFHEATFESTTTFENAVLDRPLKARGLKAKGDLEFQTAQLHSCSLIDIDTAKISVEQADIVDEFTITDSDVKRLDCTGARLRGDVRIRQTDIDDQFLSEHTSYGGQVSFESVTIGSKAAFTEAEFDGRVRIVAGQFGVLNLDRATFHDQFQSQERVWLTRLQASRTRFEGDVVLDNILCKGGFDLEAAIFQGTVELNNVRVVADATAENASFEDQVKISDSGFGEGLSLRKTTFDSRLQIDSLTAAGASVVAVDLAHAKLTAGILSSIDSGKFSYDFTHATIGDIRLSTDADSFGDARIHRTTFDGFDFSDYQTELEAHNWSLHDEDYNQEIPTADPKFPFYWTGWRILWYVFAPMIVTIQTLIAGYRISETISANGSDDEETSEDSLADQRVDPQIDDDESLSGPIIKRHVGEIQTTYLKAKNGANQVGAAKIASEFFRREMHYRQVLHAVNLFTGQSRLINFAQWLENSVFRIVAGYGERGKRVVLSAVLVIIGFTGIFRIVGQPEVQSITDAFVVSAGSFVTLIFADTPQFSSEILQIIAMMEGFLGALFIALLVFTLTRSIHR